MPRPDGHSAVPQAGDEEPQMGRKVAVNIEQIAFANVPEQASDPVHM